MHLTARTTVWILALVTAVAGAAPTDPHELWLRATPRTIQELRTHAKEEVAKRVAALDRLKADESAQSVIERYGKGGYLLTMVDFWAIAEGRAIWISKTVEPGFETEVFEPMLNAFRRGVKDCGKAVKDAEAARNASAATEPRTARDLRDIGEEGFRRDLSDRAFQLALLAKLADRPDLAGKVLKLVPLTRQTNGVRKPYESINEFMADKPNVEAWLRLDRFDVEGKSLSAPPRPTATKPAVPEETRRRIRELFEKYTAALTAKDVNALAPLFVAPDRYRAIVARLKTDGIRNVDLSKATWDIEAGPGGVWKVTVANIIMDTKDGLKDWKAGNGEVEMVVVEQDGVARILRTEGDQ